MPQVVVIADDLTGANVTGVMLAKAGFRAILSLAQEQVGESLGGACDAVLCSTDSRAFPPDAAYNAAFSATRSLFPLGPSFFSKRIDSTMRGHIGAELAGAMDGLPDGETRLCLICPAFPDAGRTVLNGELFVNGTPLSLSGAASDAMMAVKSSNVAGIVKGTMRPGREFLLEHLDVNAVRSGRLAGLFRQMHARGERVVSLDAQTNEDLAIIAQSAVSSGLGIVSADPGPLTYCIASLMFSKKKERRILLAVGSVTETTLGQIKHLEERFSVAKVSLDPFKLIDERLAKEEIDRGARFLLKAKENLLLIALDSVNPEKRLDFNKLAYIKKTTVEFLSQTVNAGIAEASRLICETGAVSSLFVSGGDAAIAVFRALKAESIELIDEVMPLAAYGRLQGGISLPVVTKGGLVGGVDAISSCVAYLQDAVRKG
ncbi:MAG: four-carbon acid sugar kinase family protein [Clostridiales bacterium]|nr:four-carbon acid sugar kinase family protein [Clostridiales bacterium]